MKNLVPWLKAHWIIPVLTLVALTALPTAWYFADDMHNKDVTAFQERVKKEADSVSDVSAKQVYYLQAVDGAGKVYETSGPINEAKIKRYADMLADVQSKVGGVSQQGIDFNKADHKLLIEGLFPPPANDQVQTANLGRAFIERTIAYHKSLLTGMKAGEPAKPDDVVKLLAERKASEESRIRAELGRDMNAEELKKLTEELVGLRISAYRKRAGEISVYADATIFDGLPSSVPTDAPSPSQCWDMQERAWIDQDICKAVATTNAKASAGIPDAVVKRVVKISIRQPSWGSSGSADRTPAPVAFEPGDDKPALDFGSSITGRTSGPGRKNRWYDVRTLTVDVIIDSQKIPQFVNALSATNFISVVDMDLSRVEPLADLREGYDYGDDHVVKASITLETVWLREWRKAAMPPDVQKALGMVEGVEGAGSAAAAPPPPPRTPRPAPGGNVPRPAPGGAAGGRRGSAAPGD
jgi:hypothetical protein